MTVRYLIGKGTWVEMNPWDREKLTRFCQVAFVHYRRQIKARLGNYSFDDVYGRKHPDRLREEIETLVMEEILVLQEVLIVLALEERILKKEALAEKKKPRRQLFITAEEEEG